MSPPEFLIACVGKPSAGKSSFLNAITNARAKVGAFPFTTIQPNEGVAYFAMNCPCKNSPVCRPRYGSCVGGRRKIPIKILDVAGLIPGAHQGHGLGNQFLNDIRQANLLLHILDSSGTTDQNGKETKGYDPTADVEWLIDELVLWIWGNMVKLWPSVRRKFQNSNMAVSPGDWVEIMLKTCSGYGCDRMFCQSFVAKMPSEMIQTPLSQWEDEHELKTFVRFFVKERFPMILVLNKIDLADSDRNIQRIIQKYPEMQNQMVFTSALSELFLRKLHDAHLVHYVEGTDQVYTAEDPPPDSVSTDKIKEMDEKTKNRLEKVIDLVLFRYGTTGCQQVLRSALETMGLIPVFPVKSIHNHQPVPLLFCNSQSSASNVGPVGAQKGRATSSAPDGQTEPHSKGHAIFCDCFLIPSGTTIGELNKMLFTSLVLERNSIQVESQQGRLLSDDEVLKWTPDIAENGIVLAFKLRDVEGRIQ